MQQTDNLDLELYEPTDNANLLDGYNASMRKLDQRDGELSTLITGLNAAVTLAQADATQALTDAATADGKAVAAQTAAATADGKAVAANTALGGNSIRMITNADFGTLFSIPQGSAGDFTTSPYDIYGLLIENATMGGLLLLHMQFTVTAAALAAAKNNVEQPLLTLNGWQGDFSRYNENPVEITGVTTATEVFITMRNNQTLIEFQWFGADITVTDPSTVSADIIFKIKRT